MEDDETPRRKATRLQESLDSTHQNSLIILPREPQITGENIIEVFDKGKAEHLTSAHRKQLFTGNFLEMKVPELPEMRSLGDEQEDQI